MNDNKLLSEQLPQAIYVTALRAGDRHCPTIAREASELIRAVKKRTSLFAADMARALAEARVAHPNTVEPNADYDIGEMIRAFRGLDEFAQLFERSFNVAGSRKTLAQFEQTTTKK